MSYLDELSMAANNIESAVRDIESAPEKLVLELMDKANNVQRLVILETLQKKYRKEMLYASMSPSERRIWNRGGVGKGQ